MSDNYLKLIPTDSQFVPDESTYHDAIACLEKLTPHGEKVRLEVYSHLTFIDQGQNFEEIICPTCKAVLRDNIDLAGKTDCQKVFDQIGVQIENETLENSGIKMPCCNSEVKATDLIFNWPAGFARFELSVLNPGIAGSLSDGDVSQLSRILGCKLMQIWAHY
ncbi:hypothetical protein BTA51_19635 [Hahella sp. CCB-MM4]|uniref:hypothetical protein n=1 Tax=Hahella sp. (strain CCB-MM4) TaxID=1926491 RepID=UPI000B9B7BDF|nr:hypothetical protein [Hahella sp. CCB-MM4]OZG71835.1 hypothetical protein BTA51_19635 [Hahella sp. CCB-MM4]